jgi:hypothetical protein
MGIAKPRPKAPGTDGGLVTIDIDATIVTSCSEKAQAAPTWKKMYASSRFADHGAEGSGEPLAFLLRPGNAGPNTASEHIDTTRLALAQLPKSAAACAGPAPIPVAASTVPTWLTRPGAAWPTPSGFTITGESPKPSWRTR